MNEEQNKRKFYFLLGNTAVVTITNAFVWFALTYWVFLETRSVLLTSFIAGTFAVLNMGCAFLFGSIVDKHTKRTAMAISSFGSLFFYSTGSLLFFLLPPESFSKADSVALWVLIVILILGSIAGNLRTIALSTLVRAFFTHDRDKANGMIGIINGLSFSVTAVLSGLAIGFFGMGVALISALTVTLLAIIHLYTISLTEPVIPKEAEDTGKPGLDIRKTLAIIALIPGLYSLIFFTTFNNFLGGVFMALMDPYGLSLVSVQTWGMMFAVLSLGFIAGSTYIAKKGLGSRPLRRLLGINVALWVTCILFTIQPSIVLLGCGMLVWMTLMPFIEATEHTILQAVVPYERLGRVIGFAQSVESAAMPITAFLIGPIAQFIFIPYMTTGSGVALIGEWFGVGAARGIALVFIISGVLGLLVTLIAFKTRSYRMLSERYLESLQKETRAL